MGLANFTNLRKIVYFFIFLTLLVYPKDVVLTSISFDVLGWLDLARVLSRFGSQLV